MLDTGVPIQSLFLDMSTASVTTAWTTLSASLSDHTSVAEIYNSSNAFLQLGYGATGAEVAMNFLIFPSGGNGRIGLLNDKSARLAVRARSGTVSVGVIAINLFR